MSGKPHIAAVQGIEIEDILENILDRALVAEKGRKANGHAEAVQQIANGEIMKVKIKNLLRKVASPERMMVLQAIAMKIMVRRMRILIKWMVRIV